ncbi:MAG: hypothetical protein E7388_06460 [Ruminococcaceae bacterium]|nr:hypothetical protein [Oscillospiraceae bacterium]
MKKAFYSEIAYFTGLIVLAIGTTLMEKADLGLSMVVAPAYILHLKISEFLPFFTFGMAGYTFQALLLILTCMVLRKFKISYLFSFITAVIYGCILDCVMFLLSPIEANNIAARIILFTVGMILGAAGIAFMFRTYISPEVYELIVKEVSDNFGFSIPKTKTTYDVSSCLLAIVLSFLFFGFGHFEGVKAGTVVCALLNGTLIGLLGKTYDKLWDFKDGLKIKKYFS